MRDLFFGVKGRLEFDPRQSEEWERRIAMKPLILDVGGKNSQSRSNKRLRSLNGHGKSKIVSTDVVEDFKPDIVDDICCSRLPSCSYDGVYLAAVLEHVPEYWTAMAHVHRILRPSGEVYIFVPFLYPFHDSPMDYHRFTFAEIARLLSAFHEYKIGLPGTESGFGFVLWMTITMAQILRFKRTHALLTRVTNLLASGVILVVHKLYIAWNMLVKHRRREDMNQTRDVIFFNVYLAWSVGFCAWARK